MTSGHEPTEPIDVLTALSTLLDDHPELALRDIKTRTEDGALGLILTVGVASREASEALRIRLAELGIEFREE